MRFLTIVPVLLALLPAVGAAQQGVLRSEADALRDVFPRAAAVAVREWRPTAAERAGLARSLGGVAVAESYALRLVYAAGERFLGYALVLEERGKYRPITFLVGVGPEGAVRGTVVMVYRESRGGEVRSPRFLRQYRGKTLDDPVRAGRDIVAITGATISVHALNAGVRRALAVVHAAAGALPPRLAAGELRPLGGGQ